MPNNYDYSIPVNLDDFVIPETLRQNFKKVEDFYREHELVFGLYYDVKCEPGIENAQEYWQSLGLEEYIGELQIKGPRFESYTLLGKFLFQEKGGGIHYLRMQPFVQVTQGEAEKVYNTLIEGNNIQNLPLEDKLIRRIGVMQACLY